MGRSCRARFCPVGVVYRKRNFTGLVGIVDIDHDIDFFISCHIRKGHFLVILFEETLQQAASTVFAEENELMVLGVAGIPYDFRVLGPVF